MALPVGGGVPPWPVWVPGSGGWRIPGFRDHGQQLVEDLGEQIQPFVQQRVAHGPIYAHIA